VHKSFEVKQYLVRNNGAPHPSTTRAAAPCPPMAWTARLPIIIAMHAIRYWQWQHHVSAKAHICIGISIYISISIYLYLSLSLYIYIHVYIYTSSISDARGGTLPPSGLDCTSSHYYFNACHTILVMAISCIGQGAYMYMYMYISIYLSIYLSISLSLSLSLYIYIYIYIYMYIYIPHPSTTRAAAPYPPAAWTARLPIIISMHAIQYW